MAEAIDVFAGISSRANPVRENILVERRGDGAYVVLRSPGLASGFAAGDVIRLKADGHFDVIERSGNLAIQLFGGPGTSRMEPAATARLAALGGRLDGQTEKELIYTVNISAGFRRIQELMDEIVLSFPPAEWYYGNVYDEGGAPLRWWIPPES